MAPVPIKELPFQDGEQVLLIDQRGKRHLLFMRKSETFHSDRGWISHDAIIGQPEGSWVRSSMGLRYLAVRPTLAEFVLDMPRGAQVIYPKDLAMILFWADIYPGCRVLEAGTGSGALTLALLRAVGPEGRVITFEQREEFARRALANIHMRCGEVTNLTMRLGPVEEGLRDEEPVDRVLLDLPEPWKLTQGVARVLRPGGIFLSYVPTIIQSHQTAEALNRASGRSWRRSRRSSGPGTSRACRCGRSTAWWPTRASSRWRAAWCPRRAPRRRARRRPTATSSPRPDPTVEEPR
jgi:tRNA (adenine57-N1/adenine58-N1)-methyltransferase